VVMCSCGRLLPSLVLLRASWLQKYVWCWLLPLVRGLKWCGSCVVAGVLQEAGALFGAFEGFLIMCGVGS
jgi:hypothetical protein